MIRAFAVVSVLSFALAACGERASTPDAAAGVDPAIADPAPAAPAPAPAPGRVDLAPGGDARADGYGALDFGLTAEEARAEWTGGELAGAAPADPMGCFMLTPAGDAQPGLMFEQDLFVRYDVTDAGTVAPGGGKVGMDADALRGLYGDALQASAHKYVPNAQTFAVDATGISRTRLVFETDADGRVTTWRVGVQPQVDYVERCG